VRVRGISPEKFLSQRERDMRDALMTGIRQRIARDRIPSERILVSKRPMSSQIRARILRGEFEVFSLRRAILIADAVGVGFDVSVAA
jgi:hypothetical protein